MQYFIKTYGCQMNFSDSERLKTFFEQNHYTPASKIEQADLVLINTCGVRQTAENRVYSLAHSIRKKNKTSFIVLTGCLSHRPDVQKKMKGKVNLYLPIADVINIFPHLPVHLQPASTCLPEHYLFLQPQYMFTDMAFVPIMTGCNNFCAYCVVPYARGREWSRPFEDIVKELSALAGNGCKEITLLGQNVNSYSVTTIVDGKETMITFPKLLDMVAKQFPMMNFKFLTSHPKDYSEELIEVIASHENISKIIHLPIQAGSDKILKAMNRPYTQAHYLSLIEKTRAKIPQASFSTDIIVGFPGETEADFQETVKVFEAVRFSEAFLNKYSPRPGTAAYKLEDNVPLEEKKRREKVLRDLIQN